MCLSASYSSCIHSYCLPSPSKEALAPHHSPVSRRGASAGQSIYCTTHCHVQKCMPHYHRAIENWGCILERSKDSSSSYSLWPTSQGARPGKLPTPEGEWIRLLLEALCPAYLLGFFPPCLAERNQRYGCMRPSPLPQC